jgi:hypothetical protein
MRYSSYQTTEPSNHQPIFISLPGLKTDHMSLFNTNKNKDKKKGAAAGNKQSHIPSKGKGVSKGAAKATRVSGRAQRGS